MYFLFLLNFKEPNKLVDYIMYFLFLLNFKAPNKSPLRSKRGLIKFCNIKFCLNTLFSILFYLGIQTGINPSGRWLEVEQSVYPITSRVGGWKKKLNSILCMLLETQEERSSMRGSEVLTTSGKIQLPIVTQHVEFCSITIGGIVVH